MKFMIANDNRVLLKGLKNESTGEFVNDATVTMTLYKVAARDGQMVAGSDTLSSLSEEFLASDVGKAIVVIGAGDQRSDLRSTLVSVDSINSVTLADSATVAVEEAEVWLSVPDAVDLSLTYIEDSDGDYEGTLDNALLLERGACYVAEINADDGAGSTGQWHVEETAIIRGKT